MQWKMGKNFAGDVYVAGVVHEECFEGVAARKISEKVKPDYVVIGEASENEFKSRTAWPCRNCG